jgi:hypothetical protein
MHSELQNKLAGTALTRDALSVASVVHIDGRDRLLAHLHRPAPQVYCATHAGGDARIRWGMTTTVVVR